MTTTARLASIPVHALAGLAIVAACPGATPIQRLLHDPSRFDGTTVLVAGEVGPPGGELIVGAYQVDDRTGMITVISNSGGDTPRVGARIGVEGELRSAFGLGSRSLAPLLERRRRTR